MDSLLRGGDSGAKLDEILRIINYNYNKIAASDNNLLTALSKEVDYTSSSKNTIKPIAKFRTELAGTIRLSVRGYGHCSNGGGSIKIRRADDTSTEIGGVSFGYDSSHTYTIKTADISVEAQTDYEIYCYINASGGWTHGIRVNLIEILGKYEIGEIGYVYML